MKKLACLLMCLGAQNALAAPATHHPFTGFYLTGAVGATSAQFNVSPNVNIEIFDFTFPGDEHIYGTSASGLVGLSYLHQFNERFVLGGEVTAGYTRAVASYREFFHEIVPGTVDASVSTHLESELTNDFALLLKPGIICGKDTMFYAILGPRWGNFKTSTDGGTTVNQVPDTIAGYGSDSVSGYELGFTAGVGIEQIITEQFHLSLEYAYTTYGEINAPNVHAELIFDGAPTGEFYDDKPEVDARTNTVMLAFSYHWK